MTDGTEIEVHPAFHFNQEVWNLLPQEERTRLRDERNAHRRRRLNSGGYNNSGGYDNNDGRSTISEITMQQQQRPNNNVAPTNEHTQPNDARSVREANSTTGSIMGGRNEQASLRSRNTNDRE